MLCKNYIIYLFILLNFHKFLQKNYKIIWIYNIYYFFYRKYLYILLMNGIMLWIILMDVDLVVGPLVIDTCHRLVVFSYKYDFHCITNHTIEEHNTIFSLSLLHIYSSLEEFHNMLSARRLNDLRSYTILLDLFLYVDKF